jgi:hypothetical protein
MAGVMRRTIVLVNDKMQSGYSYELSAEVGKSFNPEFHPELRAPSTCQVG